MRANVGFFPSKTCWRSASWPISKALAFFAELRYAGHAGAAQPGRRLCQQRRARLLHRSGARVLPGMDVRRREIRATCASCFPGRSPVCANPGRILPGCWPSKMLSFFYPQRYEPLLPWYVERDFISARCVFWLWGLITRRCTGCRLEEGLESKPGLDRFYRPVPADLPAPFHRLAWGCDGHPPTRIDGQLAVCVEFLAVRDFGVRVNTRSFSCARFCIIGLFFVTTWLPAMISTQVFGKSVFCE